MIGIGIFFSVIGLGYLCWALFDLIVYALPAFVGVTAGFAAYHSGAGVLGAVIVAPIAGGFTLGVGQAAIETYPSPKIRTGIALLFAVPAAWVGYMLTLGLAQLGIPSVATGICAVRIHGGRRHGLGAHDAPARATWRTMTWL
jgi:hypothetical protein